MYSTYFSAEGTHVGKGGGGDLKPLSSLPEDIAKQEHVQLGNKNGIAKTGHSSGSQSSAALTILAGVGTALFLVTVVIGLVMIRFQSCRNGSNGGFRMSRHGSSTSSGHSRNHHSHPLGHHNHSSGGSIHEHTWRTDSLTLEDNSSAHEMRPSSTTASDRDLLQASPGKIYFCFV